MEAEEIDVALDELENRLDRLRSLYEQYFLGIEKIEPSVARKDVDRRFWLLRRTQIRNTARRFRLQVLVQRYNTFQQYWVRICREIENGTYSRHLLRAQKKLGDEPKTWAAKKRLGYFRKRGQGDNGHSSEPPNSGEELARMLDGGTDLDAEAASAAAEALVHAEARSHEMARAPAQAAAPSAAVLSPRAPIASTPPQQARRGALEMLDLDLDDGLVPSSPPPRPVARIPGAGATGAARLPSAPTAPASPAAPLADRRPAPTPPGTPAAARSPAAGPVPPPAPARAPASASAAISLPARPAPPRPPVAAPQAATAARVPLPKPAQTVVKDTPAAAPQPAARAANGLSEERLKQIHAELSAAKRQARQADAVSLDALTKSLRESENRLRAQHPGRTVDFHVVVKDGKPVVKPIIRK